MTKGKRSFKDLEYRINRLKKAEQSLLEIIPPSSRFAKEVASIKAKLKAPSLVEEVERELSDLKQRVSGYELASQESGKRSRKMIETGGEDVEEGVL